MASAMANSPAIHHSKATAVPDLEPLATPAPAPVVNPMDQLFSVDNMQMNMFFMDPMMKELEQNVKESTEILDRISEDLERQRKQRLKDRLTTHIPETLKGEGKDMRKIMQDIESLLVYGEPGLLKNISSKKNDDVEAEGDEDEVKDENTKEEENSNNEEEEEEDDDNDDGEVEEDNDEDEDIGTLRKGNILPVLDKHARASVLAHSIAGYASLMKEDSLKQFMEQVTSDCQLWLSRLFRFEDASAVYTDDAREGLVRVARLALYRKYPKYASEGFEALYSRPPVIYTSTAADRDVTNYLCLQLGLPTSCVCYVPCETDCRGSSKMDVEILDKLIQDDVAAAKTPTLLLAYAGTPGTGQVDYLNTMQDLCKKAEIWLHIEGNNLATLTLISTPTSVMPAKSGDSMTLTVGKWLGIPGLPYVTLYRTADPALAIAAGLNTFNPQLKLKCLPLWIVLQSLGHDGIVDRIQKSCDFAKHLHEELKNIKTIRVIEITDKIADDEGPQGIKGLIFKAINAFLLFEIVSPTVVFQYTDEQEEGVHLMPYSENDQGDVEDTKDRRNVYLDALNIWLGETLQSENPGVDLKLVELENEGVCVKFSPLDTAMARGTEMEDVEGLIRCLTEQIAVLDATLINKEKFEALVELKPCLRYLDMPSWAGLGAVQYIPSSWQNVEKFTEEAMKEIHYVNTELVEILKSDDSAFSLGFTDNDVACVFFGLIQFSTNIDELVDMVCDKGKEVESSSKYLDMMAEIVRRGIEAANEDLKKEEENRLMAEGVLRQVPVVGSLINWWSPPPKDVVKGRSFNLTSGSITSTEGTYKYHMQLQEDKPSKNQNTPPKKMASNEVANNIPSSPVQRSAGEVKSSLTNEVSNPSSQRPAAPESPKSLPLSPGPAKS